MCRKVESHRPARPGPCRTRHPFQLALLNTTNKSKSRATAGEAHLRRKIAQKTIAKKVQQQHEVIFPTSVQPIGATAGQAISSNRSSLSQVQTQIKYYHRKPLPSPKNGDKVTIEIGYARTFRPHRCCSRTPPTISSHHKLHRS